MIAMRRPLGDFGATRPASARDPVQRLRQKRFVAVTVLAARAGAGVVRD